MTRPEERSWSKLFVSAQRLESHATPEGARALLEATLGCSALLDPALDARALAAGVLGHLLRLTGATSGALLMDDLQVSSEPGEKKPVLLALEQHAREYVQHTGFSLSIPGEGRRGPLACLPLLRPESPLVRGVVLLRGAPASAPLPRQALELVWILGRQLAQGLWLRAQRAERAARACARDAAQSAERAAASAERAERAAELAQRSSSAAQRAGSPVRRPAAVPERKTAGRQERKPAAGPERKTAQARPAAATPAVTSGSVSVNREPCPPSTPTMTLWVAVADGSRGTPAAAAPLTLDNVFEGGTPSLGWLEEEQ